MLRVKLFGRTEVITDHGVAVQNMGGVKSRQVLEILACARGTAVSKDRLAELIWQGEPPPGYVRTLESYVCLLRRSLASGQGRASVIQTGTAGYVLDAQAVSVDLHEVRHLLNRARSADPASSVALVERALAVASGDLLASSPFAHWAVLEQEALHRQMADAATVASRHALALGETEQALNMARTATRYAPFAESGWVQLMNALRAVGRRSEAVQAYFQLRRLLQRELGVDPGKETQSIYLELIADDPQESVVLDGGSEARALLGLLRRVIDTTPQLRLRRGENDPFAAVEALLATA